MRRERHTLEQIVRKVHEAAAMSATGLSMAEVCRRIEISEQAFHHWRNLYGGMRANDMKRLKELEAEDRRLKKAVADLTLGKQILRKALAGKGPARARRRETVGQVRRTLRLVSERRACRVIGHRLGA